MAAVVGAVTQVVRRRRVKAWLPLRRWRRAPRRSRRRAGGLAPGRRARHVEQISLQPGARVGGPGRARTRAREPRRPANQSVDASAPPNDRRAAQHAQPGGFQRRSQRGARGGRRDSRPRALSRRAALGRRYELHAGHRRRQGRERGFDADRREAAGGFLKKLTCPPTMVATTRPSSTTVISQTFPGRNKPPPFSIPTPSPPP